VTFRALVTVSLIALAALTPLAHASPVDPTWVAGFWDNGDFDDVVLFICGIAADLIAPPTSPRDTDEIGAGIQLTEPTKPPLANPSSTLSRAPPHA
jgi:hypothetical protein